MPKDTFEGVTTTNGSSRKDFDDLGGVREEEYLVYRVRWLVLFIYSLLSLTNALLWVAFSSIFDASRAYFNYASSLQVNMFALAYLVTFIPGAIFASVMLGKYGMRRTVVVAAAIQAIGCILRVMAVATPNHSAHGESATSWAYAFVLVGQLMGGFAQPVFTNLCSRIASLWFSSSQRVLATTVASMANPLGIALGSVLPTIFVNSIRSDDSSLVPPYNIVWVSGIFPHLLTQGIIAVVGFILAFLFFLDAPPTAPSKSESDFIEAQMVGDDGSRPKSASVASAVLNNSSSGSQVISSPNASIKTNLLSSSANPSSSSSASEYSPSSSASVCGEITRLCNDGRILFKSKDFVLLVLGFSLGMSTFSAFITLIEQIVSPCGFADDAGLLGATLILSGMVCFNTIHELISLGIPTTYLFVTLIRLDHITFLSPSSPIYHFIHLLVYLYVFLLFSRLVVLSSPQYLMLLRHSALSYELVMSHLQHV